MIRKTLFFLFFLVVFCVPSFTYAQEATDSADATSTPAPLVTPIPGAEYVLPYPGLLPDNPFYHVKTIRDRIVGFLISDPIKKTEFNLLQADKRLGAGRMLVQKGEILLAEQTISKGENYFDDVFTQLHIAKQRGLATEDVVRKLLTASQKHILVLKQLEATVPEENKAGFRTIRERVEGYEQRLQKELPQSE